MLSNMQKNNGSKKNRKVIILLIVLICLGLIYYFSKTPATQSPSLSTTPTKAGIATTLQKNLEIKNVVNATFLPIATSSTVYQGDTLKTGSVGRGIVETENGTITTLDYLSEMTIVGGNASGTQSSGFLASGNLWARVKKVFDKGEFYEIETQNAVAVVHGTSFGLYARATSTTLVVAEGVVGIFPVDSVSRIRHPELEKKVPAGSKATVDIHGVILVSKISEKDARDSWYLVNNPRASNSVTNPKPKVIPTPATTTTPSPEKTPNTNNQNQLTVPAPMVNNTPRDQAPAPAPEPEATTTYVAPRSYFQDSNNLKP
jgi:hypothetical protein